MQFVQDWESNYAVYSPAHINPVNHLSLIKLQAESNYCMHLTFHQ